MRNNAGYNGPDLGGMPCLGCHRLFGGANTLSNTHRVDDPLPLSRMGCKAADINFAVREYNPLFDTSKNELEHDVRRNERDFRESS